MKATLQTHAWKNFRWRRWGAERRVERAQTREQGPPCGQFLFTLFFYPLWVFVLYGMEGKLIYFDSILCRGYRTLRRILDMRVMVHFKVWEGLMESSWQFCIQVFFCVYSLCESLFCQIILFQFRTPIRHKMPIGQFHLPY